MRRANPSLGENELSQETVELELERITLLT
jgi:hypothetical protein